MMMSEQPGPPGLVPESRPRRFGSLRGVQWRIHLGVLPSSPSASIDDLRRVSADSRRRYASLRRRLLVDPHVAKDGINSPDLSLDNPLSQNPDSSWGRFFRNAELEKMVDQDLLRLYPEDGSYFQTPGCQGMLRRILLLWSLQHPEYGYRQGMHELLAPLVYVIHVDMERLYLVKKLHEEYFTDKFDELSVYENDQTYNFDFKKFCDAMDNGNPCGNALKRKSIDELDPELQNIVLLSDSYGAEGELGIVLSEKFLEHDAYSMFDALMSGVNGSFALAEFFAHSTANGPIASLPPVIEASAALYHLLLTVDSSLHSHLVELGVEPQYFALRWLRVLFGREFSLQDLLVIWDEIFAQENSDMWVGDKRMGDDAAASFTIICSVRGSFIAAIAVTMMLHLRSSLLASENATSCLQKLLNFPQNIDVKKLLDKAKSLQVLALEVGASPSYSSSDLSFVRGKPGVLRGHVPSSDVSLPRTPLNLVPDSYWEEMWRVLHKEEELNQVGPRKHVSARKIGWSEKLRMSISRTESDPISARPESIEKVATPSVRRSLTEDLSRLGSEEDMEETSIYQSSGPRRHSGTEDEILPIGIDGSEENSSIFSDLASPHARANDPENDSERSSLVSDMSLDDRNGQRRNAAEDSRLPVSDGPGYTYSDPKTRDDPSLGTGASGIEQNYLPGKFHWLWKLGRNGAPVGITSRDEAIEGTQSSGTLNIPDDHASLPAENTRKLLAVSRVESVVDGNTAGSLRNLGQSMLEHIQVIESAFPQDQDQAGSLESLSKNVLVGKDQVTAMAALKELRKISSLLSEM